MTSCLRTSNPVFSITPIITSHGANDFTPQVHCPTGYVLGVDAADTLCVSAAGAGASEAAGAASDVATGATLAGASETAGAADSGCTSDVSDEAGSCAASEAVDVSETGVSEG